MGTVRKSEDRGHANHGWLDSFHTFSFADYYDPKFMGFSALRVINEDRVEGGQGFPTHPHRDMEIITYVISGALEHQDSMGTKSVIRPGEVQRMSAGTGIRHSEYNPNKDEATHLLQIWLLPDRPGYTPSYEQKSFSDFIGKKPLVLVASNDGRDGSITIHQNVNLYVGVLKSGQSHNFAVPPQRSLWLQMVKGDLDVNQAALVAGDGYSESSTGDVRLTAMGASEFLLFDLPKP